MILPPLVFPGQTNACSYSVHVCDNTNALGSLCILDVYELMM
jgi:hypothetical protein